MRPHPAGHPIVAVDGPAAAGKTTTSLHLSRTFALPYLESGRAYRTIAYEALRQEVTLSDVRAMRALTLTLLESEGPSALLAPGRYKSAQLRTPLINRAVSTVSGIRDLRELITGVIQSWALGDRGGIIEGRDIGTVVFPDAQVKFYLTASAEERAARRVQQERQASYEEVLEDVRRRDKADMTRSTSPLRPADDSLVIDTTGVSLSDVIDEMTRACLAAGMIKART